MNKRAIFILGLITIFLGSAYVTTKIVANNEENIITEEIAISKNEMNIPLNEETISTSVEETKTGPNTMLILKKYYKDCGHTITDASEIPEEMVNKTQKELSEKYSSWNVDEFSKEQVILTKELESFCGEHYILLEEEGKVSIYSLDEEGTRTLKETTDIAFEYLPETDKIILQNGIYVYGKEELNKIKEDYES